MSSINAVVLEWLQAHDEPSAIEVISVKGQGSDWQGSTEGGFYDVFTVEVMFTKHGTINARTGVEGPITVREDIRGEDMESLWNHVMGSWPS